VVRGMMASISISRCCQEKDSSLEGSAGEIYSALCVLGTQALICRFLNLLCAGEKMQADEESRTRAIMAPVPNRQRGGDQVAGSDLVVRSASQRSFLDSQPASHLCRARVHLTEDLRLHFLPSPNKVPT
jgi:hypothetical protein